MENSKGKPQVFHLLQDDAVEIHRSPYGSVGKVFAGEGIEAVWVKKQGEQVDPDWFSQPMVDLIVVLQGKLKVEFEQPEQNHCVLEPGSMLVLPAGMRCRAYRWPREAELPTVFLAVYPQNQP